MRLCIVVALFFIQLQTSLVWTEAPPVEFVAVIASYNNEAWCIKNLESVVRQTYPHVEIVYINDCSTDKTYELVSAYIRKKGLSYRCRIINNSVRKGAMQNFYEAICALHPHKVVATIDGDDRLLHSQVFEKLAKIYRGSSIWMTSGNFITEPFTEQSYCTGYSKKTIKHCAFRKCALWQGCQLRTFYAGLFHKIKKSDFMFNGEFLPMGQDFAIMFPLFEMASKGHIHFVKEPLYVVNTINPISDIRKDAALQNFLCNHIRNLPPYAPLRALPSYTFP